MCLWIRQNNSGNRMAGDHHRAEYVTEYVCNIQTDYVTFEARISY